MNDKQTKVVIGVLAFGAGAGIGFFLGRRQKKEEFSIAEPEEKGMTLEDIRAERANPEHVDAGEAFIKEKLTETSVEDVIIDHPGEPVRTNIFPDSIDDGWDWDKEKAHRTDLAPYILQKDEFFNEEMEYTQTTLTYYQGDDILCDDADVPVYNHSQITGPLEFGHGSGDPNAVYIRNDRLKAEYEIIRHTGKFSEEIEGLHIENNLRATDVKHSAEPRRFKKD